MMSTREDVSLLLKPSLHEDERSWLHTATVRFHVAARRRMVEFAALAARPVLRAWGIVLGVVRAAFYVWWWSLGLSALVMCALLTYAAFRAVVLEWVYLPTLSELYYGGAQMVVWKRPVAMPPISVVEVSFLGAYVAALKVLNLFWAVARVFHPVTWLLCFIYSVIRGQWVAFWSPAAGWVSPKDTSGTGALQLALEVASLRAVLASINVPYQVEAFTGGPTLEVDRFDSPFSKYVLSIWECSEGMPESEATAFNGSGYFTHFVVDGEKIPCVRISHHQARQANANGAALYASCVNRIRGDKPRVMKLGRLVAQCTEADFAYFAVPRNFASVVGCKELKLGSPGDGDAVDVVFTHPFDPTKLVVAYGKVGETSAFAFRHNCSTVSGSSGGIVVPHGKKADTLYGQHVGGGGACDRYKNQAYRSDMVAVLYDEETPYKPGRRANQVEHIDEEELQRKYRVHVHGKKGERTVEFGTRELDYEQFEVPSDDGTLSDFSADYDYEAPRLSKTEARAWRDASPRVRRFLEDLGIQDDVGAMRALHAILETRGLAPVVPSRATRAGQLDALEGALDRALSAHVERSVAPPSDEGSNIDVVNRMAEHYVDGPRPLRDQGDVVNRHPEHYVDSGLPAGYTPQLAALFEDDDDCADYPPISVGGVEASGSDSDEEEPPLLEASPDAVVAPEALAPNPLDVPPELEATDSAVFQRGPSFALGTETSEKSRNWAESELDEISQFSILIKRMSPQDVKECQRRLSRELSRLHGPTASSKGTQTQSVGEKPKGTPSKSKSPGTKPGNLIPTGTAGSDASSSGPSAKSEGSARARAVPAGSKPSKQQQSATRKGSARA